MQVTRPFSPDQIAQARAVPFRTVLRYLGAYVKVDEDYTPLDPARRCYRLQVGYQGNDFRLVVMGEKFVNELLPHNSSHRGGGGSIDLVMHIAGTDFVQSVKVCLDAIAPKRLAGQ